MRLPDDQAPWLSTGESGPLISTDPCLRPTVVDDGKPEIVSRLF